MQQIEFKSKGRLLTARISTKEIGFRPSRVWCSMMSDTHSSEPYDLPKTITLGIRDNPDSGTKLTPHTLVIIVENDEQRVAVSVKARKGWHQWNFVEFKATSRGVTVTIDLEGHTPAKSVCPNVTAVTTKRQKSETRLEMVSRILKNCYPSASKKRPGKTPAWWSRPIYCGWGDQVGMSLKLEGPGYEARCIPYNTQGLYERWVRRLEKAEVPIGTIIIDDGWSPTGTMEVNPNKWLNLRGFIDEQHKQGRKVLLWIATWLPEGLPDEYCVMMGKKRITTDPGNKQYLRYLRKQVHKMISSDKGCYNADGFKIDQLQYVPTEQTPRWGEQLGPGRGGHIEGAHPPLKSSGSNWGIELLYDLQKTIYRAAKKAKPDALVTSSTVHPYFHDTFDMVRLHDTGLVEGTVLSVMKPRADLAKAALPHHLIDTDDWVHSDFKKWKDYTTISREMGVPCLFYAEYYPLSFEEEPTTIKIPVSVLKQLGKNWKGKG